MATVNKANKRGIWIKGLEKKIWKWKRNSSGIDRMSWMVNWTSLCWLPCAKVAVGADCNRYIDDGRRHYRSNSDVSDPSAGRPGRRRRRRRRWRRRHGQIGCHKSRKNDNGKSSKQKWTNNELWPSRLFTKLRDGNDGLVCPFIIIIIIVYYDCYL